MTGPMPATVYTNGARPHHPLPPTLDLPHEPFWLNLARDDEGNALCVYTVYGNRIAYNSAFGWMFYQDTHWYAGDLAEAWLDQAIVDVLTRRQQLALQAQDYDLARRTARIQARLHGTKAFLKAKVTILADDFDREPHLLNCQNGVVDLRSGKLVAQETNYFTYCVPVQFRPQCDYSQWQQWLADVVGAYPQLADWLQMCVGYSITGYTNEKCFFYLYGPYSSGKSTFCNVMLSMLGEPLATSASFSTFTRMREGQNFDLAPLKPCRFVAASESHKGQLMNTAIMKQLTGRDRIVASFKGKDEFRFLPQFKIWLSSNHPVMADTEDDAFWKRTKVIEFPVSFEGKEDKSLESKMQSRAYQEMILAYAVHGAQMWFNEPTGLITPDVVKQSTQKHREEFDSIHQWLAEMAITDDPDCFTPSRELRASYEAWCEQNGYTAKKAKSFGESLKHKGFQDTRQRIGGGQTRGYLGLKLNKVEFGV
jgi:putative DNA primase/helicase